MALTIKESSRGAQKVSVRVPLTDRYNNKGPMQTTVKHILELNDSDNLASVCCGHSPSVVLLPSTTRPRPLSATAQRRMVRFAQLVWTEVTISENFVPLLLGIQEI